MLARDPDASLEEAGGLARAIELKVEHLEWVKVTRPKPSTLFGLGTVERIGGMIENFRGPRPVNVVIVDTALSPVQQRNLESAWECKVLDRTGLILEIFGARAQSMSAVVPSCTRTPA